MARSKSDLIQLIIEHQRRLRRLKEKQAHQGLEASPATLNEIEDIEATIADLHRQIESLDEALPSPESPPLPDPVQATTTASTPLPEKTDDSFGMVLVIDDDPRWRRTISQIFKMRKYTSVEAEDIFTAMALVEAQHFDVVTIDMQFGDVGEAPLGETLLEFIINEYPHIPCIMISGSIDSYSRIADLRDTHGLGAFIHKNEFTPKELDKAIKRAKRVAARHQDRLLALDLLQTHQQNLRRLELNQAKQQKICSHIEGNLKAAELKAAKYGLDVPVHISNEIEDYEQRLSGARGSLRSMAAQLSEVKQKIAELAGG
ncbi:MAG: response regulator [Anaerolineae bacterium]|nr:response regulator [Anaerolineae bacterium]